MNQLYSLPDTLKNWEDFCYNFFIDEDDFDYDFQENRITFSWKFFIIWILYFPYLFIRVFKRNKTESKHKFRNNNWKHIPEENSNNKDEETNIADDALNYFFYELETENEEIASNTESKKNGALIKENSVAHIDVKKIPFNKFIYLSKTILNKILATKKFSYKNYVRNDE